MQAEKNISPKTTVLFSPPHKHIYILTLQLIISLKCFILSKQLLYLEEKEQDTNTCIFVL